MLGRSHQGLVSNALKDSLTNEVVKRSGEPASWSRIRFSSLRLPQTGGVTLMWMSTVDNAKDF